MKIEPRVFFKLNIIKVIQKELTHRSEFLRKHSCQKRGRDSKKSQAGADNEERSVKVQLLTIEEKKEGKKNSKKNPTVGRKKPKYLKAKFRIHRRNIRRHTLGKIQERREGCFGTSKSQN